jgi:hypothetical protein
MYFDNGGQQWALIYRNALRHVLKTAAFIVAAVRTSNLKFSYLFQLSTANVHKNTANLSHNSAVIMSPNNGMLLPLYLCSSFQYER